jgi:HSP20 family protein
MPALTRWQPFREVTSLQERMNQLFNDFFPEMNDPSSLTASWYSPKTDVYEDDDRIILDMELPGMREEDLKLTLEGNTLSISGERRMDKERKQDRYHRIERAYGSFSRTFTLPASVDPNSVEAKYEKGVLHGDQENRCPSSSNQNWWRQQANPCKSRVNYHRIECTGDLRQLAKHFSSNGAAGFLSSGVDPPFAVIDDA